MPQKRIFIYIALIAILFMLWDKWQVEHPAVEQAAAAQTAVNANLPPLSAQLQAAQATGQAATAQAIPTAAPVQNTASTIVHVDTDVLRIGIDTQGGNLVQLDLLHYPESLKDVQVPVALLNQQTNTLHVAQSGLVSKTGPDNEEGQAVYQAEKISYTLNSGEDSVDVKLLWQGKNGVRVTKIFTFYRGKYYASVRYQIENQSPEPWSGQFYAQIRKQPVTTSAGFFGLHTYAGGAISDKDKPYEKVSFSDIEHKNLDKNIQGGWLAMQQRYFLTAWVPEATQQNHYYTRFDPNTRTYTLGYVGPVTTVAPGATGTTAAKLYAGPEVADTLAKVAPHLELTVDYGWLWPISVVIFAVMKYLHKIFQNWGWSIICVTLLIKLLFYKLSATSYRSMAKMRKLTPQLQAIKERFGTDKQKLSQSMMALYKKEKVNPLSGCLPMLVQIPFFIALYYVLIESVELRQAPFIFWIKDLSIYDPYYILPILMGVSMFLQQRLNPPPPDPLQAKVMMFLPVIFTVFFVTFPAGLVLYWLVNNCIGALQQWYILKQVEAK
jgi:YidC/Oxa1 family membrane protein insertase